jgi:hypothetical protein
MITKFYAIRHEPSGTWGLSARNGMPCMARSTLDAVLRTAERLRAVKTNGFEWPIDVMHVIDDDLPGEWSGSMTEQGEWVGRGTIFKMVYDAVMSGAEVGDAFAVTAAMIRERKGLS